MSMQPASAGFDQASGLRRMFDHRSLRVLAIAGSAELSELWVRSLATDRHVIALDHSGQALATAFRKPFGFDLSALLWGDREFSDVAVKVGERLALVPARAGIDDFLAYAREHGIGSESLFAGFLRLEQPFEWLVIHACSLSAMAELVGERGEVVLALADDPHSVQAAYVEIKRAMEVAPDLQVRLAVSAVTETRARAVAKTLSATAQRFLGATIQFGVALPSRLSRSMVPDVRARLRAAASEWQLPEFLLDEQ
ncbi:hypothetical protein BH09PSE6_BH09PSE6_20810 [soil metagenome]